MKKTFFLSFAASLLLSGTTFAYDEQMDDGFRDATLRNGQIAASEKLEEAIQLRQTNYLREKLRGTEQKNIKNQWLQHTLSRAMSGADGVSTFSDRSGELTDYSGRRATTNTAITAPNNSKRNFRTRAYDYYIDGGDAGTEVLQQDVVISSEHTVPAREQVSSKNRSNAVPDIIAAIRAMQKNRKTQDQIPTGEQKMTFRTGDSSRNFLHPYMFGTQE